MKRVKVSQIFRHIVQLIMFLLLPGLYAMTLDEVKIVYKMILSGNFNFIQALPNLIEVSSAILLTILIGRWFCGWICAFGAYNDLIFFISKKLFKVNFRVDEKVDSILKYVKYLVLVFIGIVSWTMGSNILQSTSPWDAFGEITNISGVLSTLLIGVILLILITIGAAFIERFFCRYLCPLGAIFSICSRIGMVKINKPKEACGKCRACTLKCSMGIKLYEMKSVKGGECINCLKCTEVCPRSNANVNILEKDLDSKMASTIAMATMVGVYGATSFAGSHLNNSNLDINNKSVSENENKNGVSQNNNVSQNPNKASQEYKDGTYTGSGKGFKGGTTKISVTIQNGKIAQIETLSYGDIPNYYERASKSIINNIVSKQSTSVDTVSGATYSSKGILQAVTNALSQAKA